MYSVAQEIQCANDKLAKNQGGEKGKCRMYCSLDVHLEVNLRNLKNIHFLKTNSIELRNHFLLFVITAILTHKASSSGKKIILKRVIAWFKRR